MRLIGPATAVLVASSASAQDYRFPSSEEDWLEYYPTAYKDDGGTDWFCADDFYTGHGGSDFGVGGWPGMAEGRDIVAAAPGTVDYTVDGFPDDCSTADCPGGGGFGNHVVLRHADGKRTYYGHMKTWSLMVEEGDTVTCGQKIGEAGSSGRSTGPHLHFEVREGGTASEPYSGYSSDPFWGDCSAPPSYWVEQGFHLELPALRCDGEPVCVPQGALTCNQPVTTRNDAAGSTRTALHYTCAEFATNGPEIAWSFTAAVSEPVTATLSGLSADLDLFVLPADCDRAQCVSFSTSPNAEDEVATWNAEAGTTYVVVVDGWDAAVSDLTLTVACTPPVADDDDTGDDDSGESGDDDSGDEDGAEAEESPAFPDAVRVPVGGCASCAGGGAWLPLLGLGLGKRQRAGGSPRRRT